MKKTLGIDPGTNSCGWSVRDDLTGEILKSGTIVFPEGMTSEKYTESPAGVRTLKRGNRRRLFRKKVRKFELLKVLVDLGMCPLTKDDLQKWRKLGVFPRWNEKYMKWRRSSDERNPYADRALAAEVRVPKLVLGRALFNINERRGFLSLRKEEFQTCDDSSSCEGKKESETDLGKVKGGIKNLSELIEAAGFKTAGQYFNFVLQSGRDKMERERIRCRSIGRKEHTEKEFRIIMETQGYAKDSDEYARLHSAIFTQRPLRSQKHLVGKCPLEKKCNRIRLVHPAFEEFRMLTFVNNLRFETVDGECINLSPEDRKLVCSAFMRSSQTFKFKSISKLFAKDYRFKKLGYKFRKYDDDYSVPSCEITNRIRSAFGDIPFVMQKVFDALTFYSDNEKLSVWLKKHYPELSDESVVKLTNIRIKDGYGKYSYRAISRILPFLRKGFDLSKARFCAMLPIIVKDYKDREDEILDALEDTHSQYEKDRDERAGMSKAKLKIAPPLKSLTERYREKLVEVNAVFGDDFKRLYLHGDDQYEPMLSYVSKGNTVRLDHPRLPPVSLGMLKNPVAQRSLTMVRKLVNNLLDNEIIDETDTVRVELSREVNDFATRKAWQDFTEKRRKDRDEAREKIIALGKKVTEDSLERYVLWKEQNERCLYTGKKILLKELFSGEEFDVEHTIPRSLSGDDSLANKTICDADYNRRVKRNQVPKSCPNWNEVSRNIQFMRKNVSEFQKDFRKWNAKAQNAEEPNAQASARIKARLAAIYRDYWENKLSRFEADPEKFEYGESGLSKFKKSQMSDNGIVASHLQKFLKCVFPKTFVVNGQAVAFARKAWGIQTDEEKDRTDHTHHAVDAMVIAALTPERFNAICSELKKEEASDGKSKYVCTPPSPNFAEQVEEQRDSILVKHINGINPLKQSHKKTILTYPHKENGDENGRIVKSVKAQGDTIRSPLHKDTFYGCIVNPITGKQVKVVRKSLIGKVADAEKDIDKIVDPTLRNVVASAIARMKAEGVKDIERGMIRLPSGIPVNKIRVIASHAENSWKLKEHEEQSSKDYKIPYYVISAEDSNFRCAIFDNGNKKRVSVENVLQWAMTHKEKSYIPLHSKQGFIGYVFPGSMAIAKTNDKEDIFSLDNKELSKRLYKVVKFDKQGRMTFRFHKEARSAKDVSVAIKEENHGHYGAGFSSIDYITPRPLLKLSPSYFLDKFLFEGIHFKFSMGGEVTKIE